MKVMFDINVVIDVLQRREPFFTSSAKVCDLAGSGAIQGFLPSHAVTTVFYLVEKFASRRAAIAALDWMMKQFDIVPEDKVVFEQAKLLKFRDYEDAVVAAAAKSAGCDFIVTRNIADFSVSPVKAATAGELLEICASQ